MAGMILKMIWKWVKTPTTFDIPNTLKPCKIKTAEKILIGIAAIVGLNFILKGRALKNLVFAPGPVQDFNFDGASPVIRVAVNIQNTNSLGLTIQSLAGNVYADDQGKKIYIGNVYNFQPTVVPGNSQSVIILSLRLSPVGIVDTLLKALQYGNLHKSFDVEGVVNIDGGQFTLPQLTFAVGV